MMAVYRFIMEANKKAASQLFIWNAAFSLVRVTGVEPARLSAREPKSRMSANSIIPADIQLLSVRLNKIQHFRVKVKQKQREIVRIPVKELTDIVLIIAFATADNQQRKTDKKWA